CTASWPVSAAARCPTAKSTTCVRAFPRVRGACRPLTGRLLPVWWAARSGTCSPSRAGTSERGHDMALPPLATLEELADEVDDDAVLTSRRAPRLLARASALVRAYTGQTWVDE